MFLGTMTRAVPWLTLVQVAFSPRGNGAESHLEVRRLQAGSCCQSLASRLWDACSLVSARIFISLRVLFLHLHFTDLQTEAHQDGHIAQIMQWVRSESRTPIHLGSSHCIRLNVPNYSADTCI